MADPAQLVGLLGVVLVLLAYFLLAAGRLTNRDARYPWLNIVGTSGILFSLTHQWNLPAIVLQVLWIMISIAGLMRIYLGRTR